ncbi:hypothetical protein C8R42DRAFT_724460 [Lentinula raphanica]|nr:hypothetical protein C8R42DRAFT_724460 [Lentinula raphanica]
MTTTSVEKNYIYSTVTQDLRMIFIFLVWPPCADIKGTFVKAHFSSTLPIPSVYNMLTCNPAPRPNFIASCADGEVVFLAYPRFESTIRVPPNQIFRLIRTGALNIRCFCDRTASAFQVTNKDSVLYEQFVTMCKRKDCKYFVNLSEAYHDASYLRPEGTHRLTDPALHVTPPDNNPLTSSNRNTRSSKLQRVKKTTRSSRPAVRGVAAFSGYGTKSNPINLEQPIRDLGTIEL